MIIRKPKKIESVKKIKNIFISGAKLNVNEPNPISVFTSVFGIGHITAKKIASMFLLHPQAKTFKNTIERLAGSFSVIHVFSNLITDHKLKRKLFEHLKKKVEIKTYKGLRFFQNLPSRGQRTHTNAGTPKRNLNPLEKLQINKNLVASFKEMYLKMEYMMNRRSEELRAFLTTKEKQEQDSKYQKKRKSASALKAIAKSNQMRNNKFHKNVNKISHNKKR